LASKPGYDPNGCHIFVRNVPTETLVINAPDSVDENEIFSVLITVNNNSMPDVFVEFNGNIVLTDQNGTVEFQAPEVINNTVFEITASKDGYINTSDTILVIDIPKLVIDAPPVVFESSSFEIIVSNNNNPVSNASVVFNNNALLTDINGSVSFVAPEVNNTTYFLISASKNGYINASTLLEVRKLREFLIIAPSEVNETEEFYIEVFNNETGWYMHYAKITVGWNNSTNFAIFPIFAPLVNNDTIFSIYIQYPGYRTATISILIKDVYPANQLLIFAPSYVNEKDSFTTSIFAGNQSAVNVSVTFDNITKYTNETGKVTFTAPEVNNSQNYTIFAYKDGYLNASSVIRIRNILPKLNIYTSSPIYENQSFTVQVTANNIPIENVKVTFMNQTGYTNLNGTVAFIPPIGSGGRDHLIFASKEGYITNSVWRYVGIQK